MVEIPGISQFMPAAMQAAMVSGDPLADGRVASLLNAVGGPSYLVTGRKSALGGRLGALLNSITPSMAARLARRNIGMDPSHPVGAPSMARAIRHHRQVASAQSVRQMRVTWPGRMAALLLQVRLCRKGEQIAGVQNAVPSLAVEQGGKMVGPVPPVDASSHGAPLGWPWDKSAPIAPPSAPPPACRYAAAVAPAGSVIDLFT